MFNQNKKNQSFSKHSSSVINIYTVNSVLFQNRAQDGSGLKALHEASEWGMGQNRDVSVTRDTRTISLTHPSSV